MRHHTTLLITVMTCLCFCISAEAQETESEEKNGPPVLGTPEKLHGGFEFTEGPAPDLEGNVYFTDIPAERIHIHRPDGTLETFMTGSGRCNGLMFDKTGRLWACQGGEGRVIRIDTTSKEITPVADYIDGGTFLSTNDLVLDAHGGAYFTDPAYWRHADSKVDEGVYYVASDGAITRVAEKLLRPNGILLSPDGNTLYILPTGEKRLIAHEVLSPGKLGPGRDLAELGSGGDGLTTDTEGNLYITQPQRRCIDVYSPEGKKITSVKLRGSPSNICFGGPKLDHLYVTAGTNFYRIPVNKIGLQPGSIGAGRNKLEAAD
jgi:gluconolactonase